MAAWLVMPVPVAVLAWFFGHLSGQRWFPEGRSAREASHPGRRLRAERRALEAAVRADRQAGEPWGVRW